MASIVNKNTMTGILFCFVFFNLGAIKNLSIVLLLGHPTSTFFLLSPHYISLFLFFPFCNEDIEAQKLLGNLAKVIQLGRDAAKIES